METKAKGIIGYTDEDLAKMSKEKREKILTARKERLDKLQEKTSNSVSAEDFNSESVSDRAYNGKFNKIYNFVRQSLVTLKARKTLKQTNGEALYNETLEMLEDAKSL